MNKNILALLAILVVPVGVFADELAPNDFSLIRPEIERVEKAIDELKKSLKGLSDKINALKKEMAEAPKPLKAPPMVTETVKDRETTISTDTLPVQKSTTPRPATSPTTRPATTTVPPVRYYYVQPAYTPRYYYYTPPSYGWNSYSYNYTPSYSYSGHGYSYGGACRA